MAKVKAILTKPLDGLPEGAEAEFDQADFDRLHAYGAVKSAAGGGKPLPEAETDATGNYVGGVKVDEGHDKDLKAAPRYANKKAPPVGNKVAD